MQSSNMKPDHQRIVSLTDRTYVEGVYSIVKRPEVLQAVNPLHGVAFFAHHGTHGFLLLGSVVLCITGGEALYADMGNFGKLPIRVAWFAISSIILRLVLLNQ
jgi:KUP system potassium uptake protein